MNYKKNSKLDYMLLDEISLAAFNPETKNTYFFDETGIDILNALEEPCDIDTLLSKLCQMYAVTPTEIRFDVEEFLTDAIAKGVVETL